MKASQTTRKLTTIAMLAAVAASVCAEPVRVCGAEAVNKSYPGFWKDFTQLKKGD